MTALEVDPIFEKLGIRADHALEFHFAGRKRHAAAGFAQPAEEEARQLPHTVKTQAARHDRIALEVAGEIPVVGTHVIFRADIALVEGTTGLGNIGDAMNHQHRGQGQLGIARAEQFAATAFQDLFIIEAGLSGRHELSFPRYIRFWLTWFRAR